MTIKSLIAGTTVAVVVATSASSALANTWTTEQLQALANAYSAKNPGWRVPMSSGLQSSAEATWTKENLDRLANAYTRLNPGWTRPGADASAARAKTAHRYTSVIQNTALSTAGGYPAVGSTAVLAGSWVTNLFGNGALIERVTITGHPTPTTFTFKGTEVGFVANGTFKDTFTGTATVRPDGTQALTTTGRITGGTGAYRGATGSFTFSGSTTSGSSVVSGRSVGTISY